MEDFLKKVIEGTGIKPSEVVLQSLNHNFNNFTNVEWYDKGECVEAIFYKDKLEHIAKFDLKGSLIEYRIYLPKGYLPENLKEIVTAKGGEIMNVIIRNKGNSIEYEVIIRDKELSRYLIRLSEVGGLLEKKKL